MALAMRTNEGGWTLSTHSTLRRCELSITISAHDNSPLPEARSATCMTDGKAA
jgi:hypothetical protein